MTTLLLCALLSASTPAAPAAAAPRPVQAASIEAAQAEAKRSSKSILASFYTSWCGWCRKLDKETFRDARVLAKLDKELVYLHLDAEDSGVGSRLAARYRVSSYPTMVLLDAEGKELHRMSGFRTAEQLIAEIDGAKRRAPSLSELLEREAETPDDPQVLFQLASTLERTGRDSEALPRYARLLAMTDERAKALRNLALWNDAHIAERQDLTARALEDYWRLLRESPGGIRTEETLMSIARLHERLGEIDEAIAAYADLLQRFPGSAQADVVRAQLDRLKTSAAKR